MFHSIPVAEAIGCGVLLLHHFGKQSDSVDSGDWWGLMVTSLRHSDRSVLNE